MKITKYPQSCLLIEKDGRTLLIDPGSFVRPAFDAPDFGQVDAVLITHEHADHVDTNLLSSVVASGNVMVVGNASTKRAIGDMITKVVADGDVFEAAGFTVTARELPHMVLPNGQPGPQNTGYVIDGIFFHPGDGLEIGSLRVPHAAVPIAGPDASPRDIVSFIDTIGARTVIPIHGDNKALFPGHPEAIERLLQMVGSSVRFISLENGESTELIGDDSV